MTVMDEGRARQDALPAVARREPLALDIAVLSRRGNRLRNEDACGYWTSDASSCLVVSDGAGGHGGGDIASKLVVSEIVHQFSAEPAVSPELVETLVRGANRAVLVRQRVQPEFHEMRATVAVLLVDRVTGHALWGSIGDTRIYGFREGAVFFQTRDHSVMQTMMDIGPMHASALRKQPGRQVLLHALGGRSSLPHAVMQPAISLHGGDALLICTDGLWEPVIEDMMQRCLDNTETAAQWLAALEHYLLQQCEPGQDNYSAIAVRIGDSRSSALGSGAPATASSSAAAAATADPEQTLIRGHDKVIEGWPAAST